MNQPLRNSRMRLSQGQIFWREVGEGPSVVFLHGTWNDSSQWLSVMEHLSLDHHCIAPDLPGFGDSKQFNFHYSVELELECLAEYLEALKLRQVYLVGHSLGGWIAASYALKHLDQVCGLVLLTPEGISVEKLNRRWWGERWLLRCPPLVFQLLRSLRPFTKILGWQEPIEQAWRQRQQLLNSHAACQLLFQRRNSEIATELLQERLPWLKVPVLLLQGEQDTPAALALSQAYAELAPTAQLQILSHAGSDLPHSLPDTVAEYIRHFVATASQE